MTDAALRLDRQSVVAAVADYLLQVNYRGYRPDPRKVLAVRRTDRTAWLRNEGIPVRWEVYYYIEGELFPDEGATRLAEGESAAERAEALVGQVWPELWVWNGYDFTPTSFGLNQGKYSDEAAVVEPAGASHA